jgi:osmotically-inducible protein OsmY
MAAEEAKGRILAALVRNAEDEAANIHVEARGTTVELTGTVLTWDEFEQAGDAALSTPGVTSVRNDLRVSHPEPAGPASSSLVGTRHSTP